MSIKAGECHKHGHGRRRLLRKLCIGLLIFNFFLLVTVLLAWAVIQPKKPQFVLQDITVYAFNTSVPNFLTSNLEVTIRSRNPTTTSGSTMTASTSTPPTITSSLGNRTPLNGIVVGDNAVKYQLVQKCGVTV
ncbi:hypothetical protein MLD38_017605 [Melastoma candidum]|uniref:Uncharacterized protein n=1 Tax=Melastoma candidum TaxID=119954 RepID=A0ACB9QR53_9MYRT|nr:hypothetical protein MLD38_017605 [Melastoma candidum]